MAEVYQSRHKGYEIDNILDGAKPIIEDGLSANKILMPNNELLPTYLASTMASKDYVQEEIEKSKGIVAKARLVIKSIYETNTRPEDVTLGDLYEFNKIVVINEGFTVVHQQVTHEDIDIVLELDGGHKYHVKQYGVIGSKETLLDDEVVTLYGGDYREIFVNAFDKHTWAGIKRIVNAGKTNEMLQIGDEMHITFPDDMTFKIVAMNLDEEDEVIFMADACSSYLGTQKIYNIKPSNNTASWYGSDLRKTLNTDYYNDLPHELKAVISERTTLGWNTYYDGSGIYDWYESIDKIWIPSVKEMAGITHTDRNGNTDYAYIWAHEHPFPVFTSSSTRIRTLNGSNKDWWLRSVANTSASSPPNFIYVAGGGETNNGNTKGVSDAAGVVPCFCIRRDKNEINSQSE